MTEGNGRDTPLTWALCVVTLNRIDTLVAAMRCALAQTVPATEIAVVDASDDWQGNRDRIAALMEGSGVRLHYEPAPERSTAVQRNTALALVSSDLVFFFDDDTLMHPTCAQRILSVYEADPEGRIVGANAVDVSLIPDAAWPQSALSSSVDRNEALLGQRKGMLSRIRPRLDRLRRDSRLLRWLMREVLLMSADRLFIPYDRHRARASGRTPRRDPVTGRMIVRHLPGFAMTARRSIAERERFNPYLLAYCPAEDLDASYRFGRHGLCVVVPEALVHHFEAAKGRLARREVILLGALNSAFFTRLNSDAPARHVAQYYVLTLRRVLAEVLKDLCMGRLTFPQVRGVVGALVRSVAVFRHPLDGLGPWYRSVQRDILGQGAP